MKITPINGQSNATAVNYKASFVTVLRFRGRSKG